MKNEFKNLEEILCDFTTEYTSTELKKLINEAFKNKESFDNGLLKDLTEITFAYDYIDEVEALEADYPLHNKAKDLVEKLEKIKGSTNRRQKECYLGQIYNTYSNHCNDCAQSYDYLKKDDLYKYLLSELSKIYNLDSNSSKYDTLKSIIDVWITTLNTFDCKNKNGVSEEFHKKLDQM